MTFFNEINVKQPHHLVDNIRSYVKCTLNCVLQCQKFDQTKKNLTQGVIGGGK